MFLEQLSYFMNFHIFSDWSIGITLIINKFKWVTKYAISCILYPIFVHRKSYYIHDLHKVSFQVSDFVCGPIK